MISVLLPTRDNPDHLKYALRALKTACKEFSGDIEILVLDGGQKSCKGILARYKTIDLHLVEVEPWWSYSELLNQSVPLAQGETILLTHDDAAVPKDVFHKIGNPQKKEILSLKTVYPGGRIEKAGVTSGVGDPSPRFIAFGLHTSEYQHEIPRFAPMTDMVCTSMRKEFFDQLGGFNIGYHWGYEGWDLSLRAWESGGVVKIVTDSHCVHYGGASRGLMLRSSILNSPDKNSAMFGKHWLLDDRLTKVMLQINEVLSHAA